MRKGGCWKAWQRFSSGQRYDKGAEMASIKAQLDQLTHPLPEILPFVVADGLKAVMDALRYKASHRTPDTSS